MFSVQANLTPSANATYGLVLYAGPRGNELVGPNDGTVDHNLSVICFERQLPQWSTQAEVCAQRCSPLWRRQRSLNMNFTLATPAQTGQDRHSVYFDHAQRRDHVLELDRRQHGEAIGQVIPLSSVLVKWGSSTGRGSERVTESPIDAPTTP